MPILAIGSLDYGKLPQETLLSVLMFTMKQGMYTMRPMQSILSRFILHLEREPHPGWFSSMGR
jgi:hypothetical protein